MTTVTAHGLRRAAVAVVTTAAIAIAAAPASAGEPLRDACAGWGPAAPVWTTIDGATRRDVTSYVGDEPSFCPEPNDRP